MEEGNQVLLEALIALGITDMPVQFSETLTGFLFFRFIGALYAYIDFADNHSIQVFSRFSSLLIFFISVALLALSCALIQWMRHRNKKFDSAGQK